MEQMRASILILDLNNPIYKWETKNVPNKVHKFLNTKNLEEWPEGTGDKLQTALNVIEVAKYL